MKIFVPAMLVVSFLAFGSVFGSEQQDFCARTSKQNLARASLEENRLAFENNGGMFNGGVCWWHSRFERSANYLAVFLPEQPKPTDLHAKKIIHQLMLRRKVVEIPGFKNLKEFSSHYENLIQKQLNRWQVRDGLGNQVWVFSVSGKSVLTPEKLKAQMDKIYSEFEKYDSMVSLMLQFKGIDAHMWNLISMEKTADGYNLVTTDSNFIDANIGLEAPLMETTYRYGQTSLNRANVEIRNYNGLLPYDSFAPYPILNRLDLRRIKKAVGNYCGDGANQQ